MAEVKRLVGRLGKALGPGFFAVLLGVLACASPAQARWLRAESERFIVYSDGNEPQLRRFVQELESFDRLLRVRLGLPMDEIPLRKLPIYLVSSRSALAKVNPNAPEELVGFYSAAEEDIFGLAVRDTQVDVLKHEYAHHFMSQNFSFPYPGWFIEGFAEYYATAEFARDRVNVGKYNENRSYWLMNGTWVPMRELLATRAMQSSRHRETYYPLAWLLTHWFMSTTDGPSHLAAYLADVGAGGDPVEAMQRATGLTPDELQRTLRRYMANRMQYRQMRTTFETVEVVVTPLPRSADDLLLLNQRLKMGVPEDQREATAGEVRRAAARHPDDPLALLALGHAELHFGDPAKAEAPLARLLELQPDHVEALQFMAQIKMAAADELEDFDAALRMKGVAQSLLARAHAVDDLNYTTLLLIAENRAGTPGYPTDNDVSVLAQAFTLAPQLGTARINLAQVLMHKDRNSEAARLLEPMVNDPHNRSEHARVLLQRALGLEGDDADEAELGATDAADASAD